MDIILVNKGCTENRPPILSVIHILRELNHKVTVITSEASANFIFAMKEKNVKIVVFPSICKTYYFFKIVEYLFFRKRVLNYLDKNFDKNTLIWIADGTSIVALGPRIKNYKFILQIQELHEKSKMQLHAFSKVIHYAQAVFMPEYNRTFIYQIWFKLKKRPIVLPNKPYFIPSSLELQKLKQKHKNKLDIFKNKKVILYQGGISSVRMLDILAHSIINLGNDYVLLLVGKEQEKGYVNKLKQIDNSIVHISYLPAPEYLVFATVAYIGYVCYEPTSLNNAYCAPNKINEYSAFSLPMIGNNIPGLKSLFKESKAGIIIEENTVNNITEAIMKIDSNYSFYQNNSKSIFSMNDNLLTINKVLNKIQSKE